MKKNKIIVCICLLVISILLFSSFLKNNENDEITNETEINQKEKINYKFRTNKLLSDHFEKHGKEMGFSTKEEYQIAAEKVINNKNSLHKKESEDNDDIYYLESTNEFVILSTDGYIRTYFKPEAGKKYFDKQ